jgi:hypothetical protein
MASSDDLKKDLQKAVSAVGGYVAAREDRILDLIERTAGKVDERTEKRYTSTIDKVRAGLHSCVTRLAEQGEPDAATPATHDPDAQEPDKPEGPPLS